MNNDLLRGAFKAFAVKMILNNLVIFCGAVVNGIVISRYLGTDSMAAYQLTLPLFFVVMMLSQVISIGVQNNCAKSMGAGRGGEAGEYYSLAVLLCLPLSLCLGALVYFEADSIAALLGAAGEAAILQQDTADYLRGFALGVPPLFFLPMQIALLFLEGRAKWAMRAVAAQTGTNILGAFANVLFLGGGIYGMGLVMSLSSLMGLGAVSLGFSQGQIRFCFRGLQVRKFLDIFYVGLPSAVDRFYKTVQMYVVNRVLLLAAPPAAMAAFADINALNNIFNPLVMGLSTATLTMAGVFAGERDRLSLAGLLQVSLRETLLLAGSVALLVFLGAPLFIGLFAPAGGEAHGTAVHALRIYILYLPLYACNNVLQKYYLGVNAMRMTYLTSALDNLIFICLLSALLGYFFGAEGVWWSFVAAEALTTFSLWLFLAWQKRGLPEGQDFLCLPEALGSTALQVFAASASSREELTVAAGRARTFLLAEGAGEERVSLLARIIEATGAAILGRGSKSDCRIDVGLVKEEGFTLRFRDNCPPLDYGKKLTEGAEELAALWQQAEEVRYTRTLGLNYLIMRF